MAASDAQAFPIKNTAHREYGVIFNVTTGQVLTGGLSSLTATMSKDGGNFAACTNTPVEIQTSGFFSIDFTADEMNADFVQVKVTEATANSTDWERPIYTVDHHLPATDVTNKAVLIQDGTGTGQLDLTAGKVDLAATGLDAISAAAPTAAAATTFPKKLMLGALYATGAVVVTEDDVKLYDTVGGTLLGTGAVSAVTTPGSESVTKGALA